MNNFSVLWKSDYELDFEKIRTIRNLLQQVEKNLAVLEASQNQSKKGNIFLGVNLEVSVSRSLSTLFVQLIKEIGTKRTEHGNPVEDIVYINKIEFDNITLFDLFDDKRRAFEEEKQNVETVLSEFKDKISADYQRKAEAVIWWLSERITQLKTQRNDTTDTKNETIRRIRDRFRC